MTGLGNSRIPRPTSADGPTVVLAVAVLLTWTGSDNWLPAITVAMIVPSAFERTWILAEPKAPRGSVFTFQITMLPANVKLLMEDEAPSTVTELGRTLVTVTDRAVDGPLLVTKTEYVRVPPTRTGSG